MYSTAVYARTRRKPRQYVSVLACVRSKYCAGSRAYAPQTPPIRFGPCVRTFEVLCGQSCVRAANPANTLRSLRAWVRSTVRLFARKPYPYASVLSCVGSEYCAGSRAYAPQTAPIRFGPCARRFEVLCGQSCVRAANPGNTFHMYCISCVLCILYILRILCISMGRATRQ